MNIKQIQDAIETIFTQKKKRIIFWYDGEKEFEDILASIQLDNVKIVRLDKVSALSLKVEIEFTKPTQKYVLYAPFHEPPPEKDWLIDIRLYSYTFHADIASIILKELNLNHHRLKPYIQERQAFFVNKDRFNRLKKWVIPDDSEDDIDLKMLSVLTRSDQPELFSILLKLFESCIDNNTFDDSISSKFWSDIEKLGLAPSFWKFVSQTFGYIKTAPTLYDFLIRVFITDFSNQIPGDLPPSLVHFLMPNTSLTMNSTVFLSQWRSNIHYFKNYNFISGYIAKKLNIQDLLISFQVEELIEVMTFEEAERRIISNLRDNIVNSGHNFSEMQSAIKTRLDGYWSTITLDKTTSVNLYNTVYKALEHAIQLFDLRSKYDDGFSFSSAKMMFDAYTKELFLFDQHYRLFNERADIAEKAGWDVLKVLRQFVEDCYSGWFMDQLSLKWGAFLEGNDGLLNKWKLPSINNQYNFYNLEIKHLLKKSRIFVIVSDAFRYEVAQELEQIFNGTYRIQAELKPMLGILPGYTALGMASLLPYKKLSIEEKSGRVFVDEKPSGSLDYRNKILSQHKGVAIKAEDLTSMKKVQGREFIKPYQLIYIYHDQIDSMGEKKASEDQTFVAARKAIDDLSALVNFMINNLNASKVFITADHGFIYQNKPPEPIDKSALDIDNKKEIKKHKRFVLGYGFENTDNAFLGNTRETAHTDTDVSFLIPKGTNRFNFLGGAKFYHGGALLQEIVVPILTIQQIKGKHQEKTEIKKVGVSLIGNYKKVVMNISRFEFIQTDAVSKRYKPRSLKISIRDGNERISDEKMLTFDSTSSSIEDRKKMITLTLKSGQNFDNKKEYFLVLRNADDDREYNRLPLMIDIAFANDF
jgi:uncharacterized protein (TIGR02687 family)